MDNEKVILWDLMKTYFAYNPHIHAVLSEINVSDDEAFILTPHTQESVDQFVDLLQEFAEDGDLEHMARLFIGAMETAEFATQMAAKLANIDYSAIKENCDRNDVDDFEPLIKERE